MTNQKSKIKDRKPPVQTTCVPHTFQNQKEVVGGFREREELYDTGVVYSTHNLHL